MSRRDEERQKSLSLLGRIANQATPTQPAAVAPAPRAAPPKPRPKPAPAPPQPAARAPARPALDPRFEGRRAKQEEARLLKERRANELHRGRNLEWRGMGLTDIPTSIRRTGFDRVEPGVHQKIDDVLGAPKEKDGRAKNRDKGRRQGGSR